jgi:hypothetical protein
MSFLSKLVSFLKKVPAWLSKAFSSNADEAIEAILIAKGLGQWARYIEYIRQAVGLVEAATETMKTASAEGVTVAASTTSAAKLETAAAILAAQASESQGEAAAKFAEAKVVIQAVIDGLKQ